MNGSLVTKLAALSLIVSLGSCSSAKRPESIEAKMARFEASTGEYLGSPQFPALEYKFKSRGPASVADKKTGALPISNKRLYFMTLFTQYNEMRSFIKSSSPEISICPTFHSAIIEYKEKYPITSVNKDIAWDVSRINMNSSEDELAIYPELFLPVTKEKNEPRVVDLLKKEGTKEAPILLTKALEIHVLKTYHELNELCETGVSDNYYIFENLVTHTASNRLSANSGSMRILLKSTLFSNIALIDSLTKSSKKSGRSIASLEETLSPVQYKSEVMNRLKAPWAREYFDEISKLRQK